MKVAQVNDNGYCFAVSEITGDTAPEGTIALDGQDALGRMRNVDGTWSAEKYVMIPQMDPTEELAALKAKLAERGITDL